MLLTRYRGFIKLVSFTAKFLTAKIVYILAFVSLTPVTYFAWRLVQEKRTTHHIDLFISKNRPAKEFSEKQDGRLSPSGFNLIIHTTPNLKAIDSEPEMLKQLILNQGKNWKQDTIIQFLLMKLESLEKKKIDTLGKRNS